jgi:sec-independent protein translocase protein TatA
MGLENPIHLLIVLLVVLMVFGAKRLPEMGRGLGHGMRDFKDALSGQSSPASAEVSAIAADPPATGAMADQPTAHERHPVSA